VKTRGISRILRSLIQKGMHQPVTHREFFGGKFAAKLARFLKMKTPV
jgi:hypothetical protein